MARTKPAMPMFWGDYLGDTTHLKTIEHGAYFLLIERYWVSGKPLPDDDERLRIITKTSTWQWRKMKPVVMAFFELRDGLWLHGRVDMELKRYGHGQISSSKIRPSSGKKSNDFYARAPRATPLPIPEESKTPSTESRCSAREPEPTNGKNLKNDSGGGGRAARVGRRKMDPDKRKQFIDKVAAKELGPNGYMIVDLANRGNADAIAACKTAAARCLNGKGRPVVWLRTVPGARPYDTNGPPLADQPDYVPHLPERPPRRMNGAHREGGG